jgi:hypothetical protein
MYFNQVKKTGLKLYCGESVAKTDKKLAVRENRISNILKKRKFHTHIETLGFIAANLY